MSDYLKPHWEVWSVIDIALVLSAVSFLREFTHKDKIKKTPTPPKSTGEKKDSRPKIRGSIFKRPPPIPKR